MDDQVEVRIVANNLVAKMIREGMGDVTDSAISGEMVAAVYQELALIADRHEALAITLRTEELRPPAQDKSSQ